MTDTQAMAALEVTRDDIEMAETICNKEDNPHMWSILCKKFARHRINSASPSTDAAEPVGYQVRCLLPTGNHSWRFPVLRGELSCIKEFGTDEAGIPYAVRPLYTSPPPAGDADLRKALEKCRDQFRFYEASHAAKGNLDGDAKARTNCEFAEMCELALSTPPSVPAQQGEWDGPLTAEEQVRIDAAWEKHKAAGPQDERPNMTDEQIKHMAGRFLSWKLPADFNPDGGVSFKNVFGQQWPVGTNLLTAAQAEAMIRHMLEALPATPPAQDQGKASHD